jgi:polyisoprenoid-binding protein YceI
MKRLISAASALVALAALAPVPSAHAQAEKWTIDAVHSQATFTITHMMVSRVPGRFSQISGTIMYDAKDITKSSVEVTIPATSINTDNQKRDDHLRSADFFDVANNPNVTFKSTRVLKGASKDKFQIEGDLTMRGVTQRVVLDAEFLGAGAVSVGGQGAKTVAGFDATTKVNRKDFGINWNKALDQGGAVLGDDVNIAIHIEAIKQ